MGNVSLQIVRDNIVRCIYDPDHIGKTEPSLVEYAGKQETEQLDQKEKLGQKEQLDQKEQLGQKEQTEQTERTEQTGAGLSEIRTERMTVCLEEKTGAVRIWDASGEMVVCETEKEFIHIPVMKYTTGGEEAVIRRVATVDGERNFIENLREAKDHEALQGRVLYRFQEGEKIFGLGQGEDGIYDYRGHTQYLYQHNMRIPMPVFLSSLGYAVVFDAGCLLTFNDTEYGSYMFFDCVQRLDYYYILGNTLDEIISGIRFLTGRAVMLPKWAFGYIQSKECYRTAKELADVAQQYRELEVPLDCVVQDWNTWKPGEWGQKSLDPARYGDIEPQMQRIHDMHVHTMVSIWPNMNAGTKDHDELTAAGCMLDDNTTYDAFSEKGREIYFRQAKEGLFDKGFDAWWCDSTEPFSGPDWCGEIRREPWVRYNIVGTEHKKYLAPEAANVYSLMHARGIFENQRKVTEEKRVFNLTRSGYIGSQRYGVTLWSGDTTASWETLRRQIAEGLNMAMSGFPYWTLDIGGFFTVGEKWQNRGCSSNTDPTPKWFWKGKYDEGVKDPAYCELYVRWFQFGAFLPIFRSHGTDTPREIWNFGQKGDRFYDAIEKAIKLRYLLMPYIYSEAARVCMADSTMMRSLLFDFPGDEKALSMATEYMFGRAFLVCPVIAPSGKRTTYLPEGASWYDFATMELYQGGQTLTSDVPLDTMPLFVRAGSIVPMMQGLQYASQDNGNPLEIHVFTGEDAVFTYYEDAGDGYGYEKGEYACVELRWNEGEQKLSIGQRTGGMAQILANRQAEVYINEKKAYVTSL